MLGIVKLQLTYELDCSPNRFWALYFDPDFTTRLHREGLGSTSVEIVEQHGNLASGLGRTLRYGQRPDAPGPVKRLFGEEIITTEVCTFDPALGTSLFTLVPATLADKTEIMGSIGVKGHGDTCTETFELEARVKIFGAGPIVERFIERQARDIQTNAVAFMKKELTRG
jgi:hypothetical protein